MDIKNLNQKQKTALIVGAVVVAGAVIYGVQQMNAGTATHPKLTIDRIDNTSRRVYFTVNGRKEFVTHTGLKSFPLSDRYKIAVFSERQEDGSVLKRFFHTENDSLRIISELAAVYV